MNYDYLIIGGGIIGLSTAWQLQQRLPDKKILLLEKEATLAAHQSSHNSGVIHAGLYYHPNSLKARFCREGALAMREFCARYQIPCQQTGKLLVATSATDYQRMQALLERCKDNQVEVESLSQQQLHQREPNISGLGAIYIRDTGMVDYAQVTQKMASLFEHAGGQTLLNTKVVEIRETASQVTVSSNRGEFNCAKLIVCAGLMADKMTQLMGINNDFRIIPFRGEYYRLPAAQADLISHHIYPIPDPELPFLGVHLTKMIDGSIIVGPNAVLGWKREGYRKYSISPRDLAQMFCFRGFWSLLRHNLKQGLHEAKNSLWKGQYLKEVQKYCPGVKRADLLPHPAGIRAQAVLADGSLVQDFLFRETARSLHVCNAPSPAATSSIPIGNHICEKVLATL